jgi:hypothetical protein
MIIKTRNTRRAIVGGSRTIHTHQSHLFELEKINELNGDSIYRIRINGCYYYFYGSHKKYVLTLINDDYHMLKLDESQRDLDQKVMRRIEELLPINTMKDKYALINFFNDLDVGILYFKHRECPKSLDLTNAKTTLLELNALLQKKCHNLSLHLDYVYNQHPPTNRLVSYHNDPSSLILCLYNEFGCISSIMITIDDASIMIDSETDSSFSGRKYNKLVRCTVIILSLLLSKHIKRVTSHSINPISAYLSVKYFSGVVSQSDDVNIDFFDFLQQNGLEITPLTDYFRLFDLYKQLGDRFELMVHIELTQDAIENAERAFPHIVAEIVC